MASPSTSERFPALPEDCTRAPDASEREVLERWRSEGTFEAVQRAREDAPPFVFWEGPPTANGRPGIHHMLGRSLKDSVCRFQTMAGRRVNRKAGWDTHGLPVELEVEKALGISGKPEIEKYGVAEFNARCRESVWKYREDWEQISQRIGYWLDYDHPYVTYDGSYVDSVWYLLARFHEQGLVYRGKRVLPYCGRCGTGLSSHELGQPGVYRDVKDPSVTLRFKLKQSRLPAELLAWKRESLPDADESMLAWTTTPWTLPSNFALAVNPGVQYAALHIHRDNPKAGEPRDEVVWMAEDLVHTLHASGIKPEDEAKEGGARYQVKGRLLGSELIGARYEPLFPQTPPFADPGAWEPDEAAIHQVVPGEFVTVEDGTGIVHQAPYGADDWEMARKYKMPLPEAVGPEGKLVCDVGPVKAGTFFKDADDPLMDDLKARGLLFKKAREDHSYPHCWRCDTPLFYFPAPAWYIRTTALKQRMLERNAEISWIPAEVGTKRFGEWLENNIDWNISRDRYWGSPLPFWVCDGCDREEAFGGAAELEQRAGGLPAGFDHHKPSVDEITFPCGECEGTLRRTNAVVDCWFDSGAMPYAQHGWPHLEGSRAVVEDQFPADFICEALDQTRGWFYTLHAIGAFATGLEDSGLGASPASPASPAYRACLVNGLVLDKDGVKMSKRLGNIVDPWELVAEHGADAVRWYMVSSAAPWLAKRFDPAGVAEVRRRFFSTLANSYSFFREYARIDGFDPEDAAGIPPVSERPEIDRWLVSRTQTVVARARASYEQHDLTGAARALEGFVVDELSNWYIRRNRRRFWKGETGPDKLSAFASLHSALGAVALAMAPVAPFLAEILWARLRPGTGSVHAQDFPRGDEGLVDQDLEGSMALVQDVVVMGRALREKAGIKTRQPLRALHLRSSSPESLRLLESSFATEQILEELNVKSWGSLEADDGQLCQLQGKANFRTLGKRLGPRMKLAAGAIARLDARELAALRGGASVTLDLEGGAVDLGAEDVAITVETQADFDVETDGRLVLWLDLELDEDLLAEGVAREVVTRINSLRRERGLAVEDRVRLVFAPGSDEVRRGLERFGDLIRSETLALELEILDAAPEGESVELDLGPGRSLTCSLTRA